MGMASDFVYILGIFVTGASAVLLSRGYARSHQRLLLWSAICFYGLAISNVLVLLDAITPPQLNFYPWRLATAAIAMAALIYGLIWEAE